MHIPKKEINNRLKLNAILKYEEYGQIDFQSKCINP